eukprot:scaffold6249_cov124-Isochrysis_galbana.AAC.8
MTRYLRRGRMGLRYLVRVPASVAQAAGYQTRKDTSYIGAARGMLVGWTGKPMYEVEGNDRTLTLHRGVAHLKLRRRLSDRTGGEDLRIRELRVETDGAAMNMIAVGVERLKTSRDHSQLGHTPRRHM